MKSLVYLIGAGGHSRMLVNLLELNHVRIGGVFDNNFTPHERISGYPLVGNLQAIQAHHTLILSMSDCFNRDRFFKLYDSQTWKENIFHPSSSIENRVELGQCNQFFAGAYVGSQVKIGNNNIFNTRSVVEHETTIGSHNHIAVGTIICGRVLIADRCFIGAGAVIIDKIKIGSDVIIGANAVVIRDIQEPGTYVGNPAKRIR
ncbi:MAG: NeuD/PglB/VioB family sugar acetyltransferase [Deltaproteobacteria bacterium]|nr:NeuD/PglB/VioB family sugar acetyltransferase [Deltaproteobacteria bacterium]